MRPVIDVSHISRTFYLTQRSDGVRGALRSLVARRHLPLVALKDVSFKVDKGTVLAVLGPNGSGKTTLLKCISGLLAPDSGVVKVAGRTPSHRDDEFLRSIGFVMGQRWGLHIDLPVRDSFTLHRRLYDLEEDEFHQTTAMLIDLLDLQPLLNQMARKLSLGQRMRCEFALALLHKPEVLLLDEPTLGLDFLAQEQIRNFVKFYVAHTDATVILTSHYLADIESLADTVLCLAEGTTRFRGDMASLAALSGDVQWISARVKGPIDTRPLNNIGSLRQHAGNELTWEVIKGRAGALITRLERHPAVTHVSLSDPPLEATLRAIYDGTHSGES